MKKSTIAILLGIMAVMLFACSSHNETEKMESNLKAQKDSQNVMLDNLTDFEWEKVYFIAPYTSKESIESIVGIKSDEINDNMSDESMLYLIFINKNQLVKQIYGRTEELGFDFELGEYNEYIELNKENSIFSVDTMNGIKIYSLIKN